MRQSFHYAFDNMIHATLGNSINYVIQLARRVRVGRKFSGPALTKSVEALNFLDFFFLFDQAKRNRG